MEALNSYIITNKEAQCTINGKQLVGNLTEGCEDYHDMSLDDKKKKPKSKHRVL